MAIALKALTEVAETSACHTKSFAFLTFIYIYIYI